MLAARISTSNGNEKRSLAIHEASLLMGFTPLERRRLCRRYDRGIADGSLMLTSAGREAPVLTGFTLIELLVVIAIIGLITTVVLSSLTVTRIRARDTTRVRDLREIAVALELYFDQYGRYPEPSQGYDSENPGAGYGTWSGHCPDYGDDDNFIVGLAPEFISALPYDPGFDTGSQCYLYNSDGRDYMLLAHLTMEGIIGGDPSDPGNPSYMQALDRPCCVEPSIARYTDGASGW